MTFVFFSCVKFAKSCFSHTHTNFLLIEFKVFGILFVVNFRVSKSTLLHVSFNKTHTRTHPQTHQYLLLVIKNFIKKKRETNQEKQLRYIRKVSQKEMKRVRWINATNKT